MAKKPKKEECQPNEAIEGSGFSELTDFLMKPRGPEDPYLKMIMEGALTPEDRIAKLERTMAFLINEVAELRAKIGYEDPYDEY